MKYLLFIFIFTIILSSKADASDTTLTKFQISVPDKIIIDSVAPSKGKDWNKIISDWIITLTAVISAGGLSIGVWQSLKEYRLKTEAEKRLAETQKIEADIKLITHFTELMQIAHAISGYVVSDKVIEKLFEEGLLKTEYNDLNKLKEQLKEVSVIQLPVGIAAQDGAIAALFTLAKNHEILLLPTIQAFESMHGFKAAIIDKYLPELKQIQMTSAN